MCAVEGQTQLSPVIGWGYADRSDVTLSKPIVLSFEHCADLGAGNGSLGGLGRSVGVLGGAAGGVGAPEDAPDGGAEVSMDVVDRPVELWVNRVVHFSSQYNNTG